MSGTLKGAIIGCGFFAERHLEAWGRIPEAEIVAAADPRLDRARKFADRAYGTAEEMLDRERLDFVDIVTRAETHLPLVRLTVERGIPVICQKPMAPDWNTALEIVRVAETAGVRVMIHENWRWQAWYRVAKSMIAHGDIGAPIGYGFRTRTRDGLGDEPYPKQPYFRGLQRFLIDEVLVHHMDTARFLFGEIESVYAQTSRRNLAMAGEDQGILVLAHSGAVHGWIDGHRFLDPNPDGPAMGDAFFEGELGTISVSGTGDVYRDQILAWKADAVAGYRGDSVHATQLHFVRSVKSSALFETGAREYLGTFAAVEAAYRSAAEGRRVSLSELLGPAGPAMLS